MVVLPWELLRPLVSRIDPPVPVTEGSLKMVGFIDSCYFLFKMRPTSMVREQLNELQDPTHL